MKKIILIFTIIFLIFQMAVLAIDIDIGCAAIDRDFANSGYVTWVNKGNPANASGKITSIEIWADTNLADCEVATFYVVSGNNLSTRDTHNIGSVTAGSKQTFSGLDIIVEANDYIGIFYNAGGIERDNTGDGYWYLASDGIPCTDITFTFYATKEISLCGIGATEEEEEENVIFFGMNF